MEEQDQKRSRKNTKSLTVRITPTMNMRLREVYKEYESWCAENLCPAITYSSFVPEFALLGWQKFKETHSSRKRLVSHE